MIVANINRHQAEHLIPDEDAALVSISNVGDPPANLLPGWKDENVLRLWFDDVECNEKNHMTREQAKQIADFVHQHENIGKFIIHCSAGISRSFAVAQAITDWNGMLLAGVGVANAHVRRSVSEALRSRIDGEYFFPDKE